MKLIFIISIYIFIHTCVFAQVDIQNIKNQRYLEYKDQVNCDSAISTLELRICANLNFKESDSILNNIYNSVLLEFEKLQLDSAREILINSQKVWIKYRDTHCEIYWTMYEGGTLQSIIFLNCLTDLTNNRQGELEKLLNLYKK